MEKEQMKSEIERKKEKHLRKKLDKQGVILRKSRNTEKPNADDLGGYMLIDKTTNTVVAGSRWELTLEDIERFVSK